MTQNSRPLEGAKVVELAAFIAARPMLAARPIWVRMRGGWVIGHTYGNR